MEQTSKPYRDNPELTAFQKAIDAANRRADECGREAARARADRNSLLFACGLIGAFAAYRETDRQPDPPPVRVEQDASIITAPILFCETDSSDMNLETLQLRCWSPLLTMTFDQRPSRYWHTACAFGLGCPLHRQCPRHPHWRLLDPLPSFSSSDAGASSQ